MVKKILILGALFISTLFSTYGQNKYSFGFEVGPQFSWATSNTRNVKNDGMVSGVKYGIRGDKFFGENYAFTTGLIISHTGINLQYTDTLVMKTVDDNYTLDSGSIVNYYMQYIEIPLGFKFQSKEIGYMRILFEGGLIQSFRLRAKASVDEANIDNEELKEGVRLFATSYYFEGGVAYSLGAQVAIKGSLFYSSGLYDITSDNNKRSDRITQNSFGLKLGLIF